MLSHGSSDRCIPGISHTLSVTVTPHTVCRGLSKKQRSSKAATAAYIMKVTHPTDEGHPRTADPNHGAKSLAMACIMELACSGLVYCSLAILNAQSEGGYQLQEGLRLELFWSVAFKLCPGCISTTSGRALSASYDEIDVAALGVPPLPRHSHSAPHISCPTDRATTSEAYSWCHTKRTMRLARTALCHATS